MSDKQNQLIETSPDNFMVLAREIWRQDRDCKRALSSKDRNFCESFGCSLIVCHSLWILLVKTDYLPANGKLNHLLWALMFLKIYGTEKIMCSLAGGVDKDTFRKWTWLFIEAIASLESSLVRFACF